MKIFDFTINAERDPTPAELADSEALRSQIIPPGPAIERIALGFASLIGTTLSAVEGFGFSAATRIVSGGIPRIRFYYNAPLADLSVGISATAGHTVPASCYVQRPLNANYVELRPVGAVEPTGYCVEVTRINRQ